MYLFRHKLVLHMTLHYYYFDEKLNDLNDISFLAQLYTKLTAVVSKILPAYFDFVSLFCLFAENIRSYSKNPLVFPRQ